MHLQAWTPTREQADLGGGVGAFGREVMKIRENSVIIRFCNIPSLSQTPLYRNPGAASGAVPSHTHEKRNMFWKAIKFLTVCIVWINKTLQFFQMSTCGDPEMYKLAAKTTFEHFLWSEIKNKSYCITGQIRGGLFWQLLIFPYDHVWHSEKQLSQTTVKECCLETV